jgi:hypothetical protein
LFIAEKTKKMKVGFGFEKSSFSMDKYGNCGPNVFFGGEGGR